MGSRSFALGGINQDITSPYTGNYCCYICILNVFLSYYIFPIRFVVNEIKVVRKNFSYFLIVSIRNACVSTNLKHPSTRVKGKTCESRTYMCRQSRWFSVKAVQSSFSQVCPSCHLHWFESTLSKRFPHITLTIFVIMGPCEQKRTADMESSANENFHLITHFTPVCWIHSMPDHFHKWPKHSSSILKYMGQLKGYTKESASPGVISNLSSSCCVAFKSCSSTKNFPPQ